MLHLNKEKCILLNNRSLKHLPKVGVLNTCFFLSMEYLKRCGIAHFNLIHTFIS